MPSESINNHAAFIWSVADLLRGDYKQSDYGRVILPFTVLRRLDCVIAPVKGEMLDKYEGVKDTLDNFGPVLDRLTDTPHLWNTSKYDLSSLRGSVHVADQLRGHIASYSPQIRDIFDFFDMDSEISRLDRAGLLQTVVDKFAGVDLYPSVVSNLEMGYVFEELIRRSSGRSETASEHVTPSDVIELMVGLLFTGDLERLAEPGIVKTMLDPACGTGGMLSIAEDHLRQLNPQAQLEVFGQELNPAVLATCRSDMILKGQNAENIAYGNSFSEDGHQGRTFDYLLANPPFGVEWKKVRDEVTTEHDELGLAGRFGAGLPRINDGSFLFMQHMISKMKRPEDGGSRLAIVFNGSPLFTGAAGSGESEIRRWIIENDWLEAVVALPDQLFYNTGISTYFWIVTNRKDPKRKGKVQLLDARESFTKMRKSLGEKRKQISDEQGAEIVRSYAAFETSERCKIFDNEELGFVQFVADQPLRVRWEITSSGIEGLRQFKQLNKLDESQQRSLRKEIGRHLGERFEDEEQVREFANSAMEKTGASGKPVETAIVSTFAINDPEAPARTDRAGDLLPDVQLRAIERVPLSVETVGRVCYESDPSERLASKPYQELIDRYLLDEVSPYLPDAWADKTRAKLGYEISLAGFLPDESMLEGGVPLGRIARVFRPSRKSDPETARSPYLPYSKLLSARSTVDLEERDNRDGAWTECTGGDVVGRAGTWRYLDEEFGDAITSLTVVRPTDGSSGLVLAEWLSSRFATRYEFGGGPIRIAPRLEDTPVPHAQLNDRSLAEKVSGLVNARHELALLTEGVIENPFDAGRPEETLERANYQAHRADLILAAARPVMDPFLQAGHSFPYHIAVLARRYSLAGREIDRYQQGLKLAEAIARVYGVISLAVKASRAHASLTDKDAQRFNLGVSFDSWLKFHKELLEGGGVAELPELANEHIGSVLRSFASDRNNEAHRHALTSEAAALELNQQHEPLLSECLEESSWMASRRWLYVDVCDFTRQGHTIRGEVLQGSHPDWERFETVVSKPVISRSLYIECTGDGFLPLAPFAEVQPCARCEEGELFILDRVNGNDTELRSLRDHEHLSNL